MRLWRHTYCCTRDDQTVHLDACIRKSSRASNSTRSNGAVKAVTFDDRDEDVDDRFGKQLYPDGRYQRLVNELRYSTIFGILITVSTPEWRD